MIRLRPATLALWLIVLLALGLRLWGIAFGLPHNLCRPDEEQIVSIAIKFFRGDLNPHIFYYPTLYMYVLAVLYGIHMGFQMLFFGATRDDLLLRLATDPTHYHVIIRCLSAVCGALTVPAIYLIAERLRGRATALAAAGLMAVSYLHVRDSHFGATDIAMVCLLCWALLYALKGREEGGARHLTTSAVLCGLAASTKYNAFLLLLPVTVDCVVRAWRAPGGRSDWLRSTLLNRAAWTYGAIVVVVFILGTPFSVLDRSSFLRDVIWQREHLAHGHGADLGLGFLHHIRYTLPYGVGWPVLILAAIGVVAEIRRDLRRAALVFIFPLLYYFILGSGKTVFLRYMDPMPPFLVLGAALGIAALAGLRPARIPPALATAALALLVGLPSLDSDVRMDRLLARTDNRLVAARWVEENIPAGSTIYQTGSQYGRLQLPLSAGSLERRLKVQKEKGGMGTLLEIQLDLARRPGAKRGYEEWVFEGARSLARRDSLPEVVIVQRSPIVREGYVRPEISRLLAEEYSLMHSLSTERAGRPAGWYDQQDAFFVPFVGLDSVERPGPSVDIYRRRSGPVIRAS